MKVFLKIISAIVVGFCMLCCSAVGSFISESYFYPAPFIDTYMSEGYSPRIFDSIKVGDSDELVLRRLGKPLAVYRETLGFRWDYTGDGKLLEASRHGQSYLDFAWYRSSLWINSGKVVEIDKGWSYD